MAWGQLHTALSFLTHLMLLSNKCHFCAPAWHRKTAHLHQVELSDPFASPRILEPQNLLSSFVLPAQPRVSCALIIPRSTSFTCTAETQSHTNPAEPFPLLVTDPCLSLVKILVDLPGWASPHFEGDAPREIRLRN